MINPALTARSAKRLNIRSPVLALDTRGGGSANEIFSFGRVKTRDSDRERAERRWLKEYEFVKHRNFNAFDHATAGPGTVVKNNDPPPEA